jgi:hypothetical protein
MKRYRIRGEYGIQIGDWIELEVKASSYDHALRRLIRECKKVGMWERIGRSNCYVEEVK